MLSVNLAEESEQYLSGKKSRCPSQIMIGRDLEEVDADNCALFREALKPTLPR